MLHPVFLPFASAALLVLSLTGCSAHSEQKPAPTPIPAAACETLPAWQKTWCQLAQRLMADGLDAGKTAALFAGLSSPPSAEPMGVKVRELYTGKFLSKAHPTKKTQLFQTKLGIPGPWFKGVVTQANARLCKKFITEHKHAFALAEARWAAAVSVEQ